MTKRSQESPIEDSLLIECSLSLSFERVLGLLDSLTVRPSLTCCGGLLWGTWLLGSVIASGPPNDSKVDCNLSVFYLLFV